jgi:hypothetical protein
MYSRQYQVRRQAQLDLGVRRPAGAAQPPKDSVRPYSRGVSCVAAVRVTSLQLEPKA